MVTLSWISTPKPSAQAKNVYELFAGKVFRVPDYQRTFAWDVKNWEDLWNDIKEGITTSTEHYWGTITLKITDKPMYCKEKDIPFTVYEIVDGQQRITALYLFLLALSKMGKPAISENFVKCGDIYRLELGGLNNQFLKDLTDDKNPKPNIRTNRLLKEALKYFENQINSYVNKPADMDTISDYVQRITFSLEFVVQDETLAVKAFESLNDRGKPLTLLDKTKSFLMFYSLKYLEKTLGNVINTVFGNVFMNYDIIKETGEKQGIDYVRSKRFSEDEVLRSFYHYFAYYAIRTFKLPVAYDYDITADDVFEQFLKKSCDHLKNNPTKLKDFVNEFLESFDRFSRAFQDIINRTQSNCQYKKLFGFLGLNVRLYPLIISLECEGILNQKMLDIIESVDVRVYKIRGTDPRADLYRDTISRIKMNPNVTQIYNGIRDFMNYFMPDDTFRSFLGQSLYGNPAVKYILWEFEKHQDASFDDCDYSFYKKLQVDHIFPWDTTLSFPALEFKDLSDYYTIINRIGNLTLLEGQINKRVRNRPPESKFIEYLKSKVPGTKKLGSYISNSGFKKTDVEKRTQNIMNFCLKKW